MHVESTAHTRPSDARIECPRTHRDQPALAIPEHTDGRMALAMSEPIDCGEHLLSLEAERVTAHLEGHAVDELPVRLIRPAVQGGAPGPGVTAVDQGGYEDAAAALGEAAGVLRFLWHSGRQADQHFRRPVG